MTSEGQIRGRACATVSQRIRARRGGSRKMSVAQTVLSSVAPLRMTAGKLREEVSELLFFRLEIFFGVGAGGDFAGDALYDLDSGAFEGFDFFGIV